MMIMMRVLMMIMMTMMRVMIMVMDDNVSVRSLLCGPFC